MQKIGAWVIAILVVVVLLVIFFKKETVIVPPVENTPVVQNEPYQTFYPCIGDDKCS